MPDLDLAVRKRLFEDFEFWCRWACKIRTKKGEIVPLVFNHVQRRFVARILAQLAAGGRVRFIVLKARQQGLSTIVTAFNYWWLSQHRGAKGLVVTHVAESTRALWDMYTRVHECCPDQLRPSTKYSSRNELKFARLDTGLIVATAGGRSIARGETITHAHLSEFAFWPKASAEENFNGLTKAIPNEAGSAVFIESTANGYNDFHRLWTDAVAGKNEFEPFFSAWFESPEYRVPAPAGFERTLEEQDLVDKFPEHAIDNDQLQWRRLEIAKNGAELFMQEYPATPDEAFRASGRPVFDPVYVTPMLEAAPQPIKRMAVEEGVLREHSRGELLVFKEFDPAQVYTIGADVAMGVKSGDFSVAQVLDGDKEQVAVWRGHIHPDAFAAVLKALGLHYSTALIAPERNNHGLLTCVRLWKDLQYPNVFIDVTEGGMADKDTTNVGFATTAKTKPLIVDRLRAEVRDGGIKINDTETLREMQTYIVTESGAMEAEEGKHDDCVMALAIANHVHVRRFTPIDVTDEFYSDAV